MHLVAYVGEEIVAEELTEVIKFLQIENN